MKVVLVWADILGFDELARVTSEQSGVDRKKIRSDFIQVINEKVKELEDSGEIRGKNYGEGEDWLLVADSIDSAFKSITHILEHNTGYKFCDKIPLEIGIGIEQYDQSAVVDGTGLLVEDATIKFLKSNLTNCYRDWYKSTYSTSIKSTFIVTTESTYKELETFEKEICRRIEYQDANNTAKKTTFFEMDLKKVLVRGKFLFFLKEIGRDSTWYRRVDRIFVPPNEYEMIHDCLNRNKVVFLVGDPEIGKTYTAVRILWEYYSKGYRPIWYFGSEADERTKVRQRLSDCRVPDHSITYFEDPFGRTTFEDREELRRTIDSFIAKIQELDSRVVITSRETVFREFEREKLSPIDLRAFTVEMRLMKPTYNKEKMKTILTEWAREFECKWLQDAHLRTEVVETAAGSLHTPLSLRDFALDSKKLEAFTEIKLLIEQKSLAVKEAFAEEIASMKKERIVFLSLAYILDSLDLTEIKTLYKNECRNFGLDADANPFEILLDYFDTKIRRDRHAPVFEFTHPSYEEGLLASWNRIETRGLLLNLLADLVQDQNPFVRGLCGHCLVRNFSRLSFRDEARNLIEMVLNDRKMEARFGVALGINHYFKEIPLDQQLEYINAMINDNNREIRNLAVNSVRNIFNKVPVPVALGIISQGLDDRAAIVRLETVGVVRNYRSALPEHLAFEALEVNRKLCNYTGWFIRYIAQMTYRTFKEEIEGKRPTASRA